MRLGLPRRRVLVRPSGAVAVAVASFGEPRAVQGFTANGSAPFNYNYLDFGPGMSHASDPNVCPAFSFGSSLVRSGVRNDLLTQNLGDTDSGADTVWIARSFGQVYVETRASQTVMNRANAYGTTTTDGGIYDVDVTHSGKASDYAEIWVNDTQATVTPTTRPAAAPGDPSMSLLCGEVDRQSQGAPFIKWAQYLMSVQQTPAQRAELRSRISAGLHDGAGSVVEHILSIDPGGSYWYADDASDLTVGVRDLCGNRDAIAVNLGPSNLVAVPS